MHRSPSTSNMGRMEANFGKTRVSKSREIQKKFTIFWYNNKRPESKFYDIGCSKSRREQLTLLVCEPFAYVHLLTKELLKLPVWCKIAISGNTEYHGQTGLGGYLAIARDLAKSEVLRGPKKCCSVTLVWVIKINLSI